MGIIYKYIGGCNYMSKKVRTRYAPSPTGCMHIGNLRTALYEYLIAKSLNGDFVLRIEDTDKERHVQGAEDKIYKSLELAGLKHDEGPDIGGNFGPYIQSQRTNIYIHYAQKLIEEDKAYYCFCSKERLESLKSAEEDKWFGGYDRKCRALSKSKVEKLKNQNIPYVIRQKIPLEGTTVFTDEVFGKVNVDNKELQDQILIKADGYPTYNFANVIDDHEMQITHVVRGCEYLSSTPKYNLLYEAFGWEIPKYIHLPLIMGKNDDGSISKLSKRHGSISFEDLILNGYLPEAIVNYIALLGWCPEQNIEIFSLDEMVKEFSVSRISKSSSIFDYNKLLWFNGEYIRNKTPEEFMKMSEQYIKEGVGGKDLDIKKISRILHQRTTNVKDIPDMIKFLSNMPDYSEEIFINKKSKTDLENSLIVLKESKKSLFNLCTWSLDNIHNAVLKLAKDLDIKNGTAMWPIRIAISGKIVTPGGVIEILDILGKEESIKRIDRAIEKLSSNL